MGWPELSVDLMLPQTAFDEFCVQQQAQPLSDGVPAQFLFQKG
ncbi:phenol hydroxylase subunit [Polaromonas sp. P1(28)-13]|nr:phenol hydroxylase subunit [Polaromonas sp. P1(28)-13]